MTLLVAKQKLGSAAIDSSGELSQKQNDILIQTGEKSNEKGNNASLIHNLDSQIDNLRQLISKINETGVTCDKHEESESSNNDHHK